LIARVVARLRPPIVLEAWERFWFAPGAPQGLALLRIGFYFFTFLTYRFVWGSPSHWGDLPSLFWVPAGVFHFLPRLSHHAVDLTWRIWLGALALSCVGCLTRLATAVAFVLGVYVIGFPYNFGNVNHVDALIVFVLGVFALSRCGDAWSLDHLLRRGARTPVASGEYRWPLQLVRVVICFVYFSAGVTKLAKSGLAWVGSDTLSIYMAQLNSFDYYLFYPARGWLGMEIVRWGWPMPILSGLTLLLELSFPLALLSPWPRLVLVPSAIAFNTAAFLLMGPFFLQLTYCNLLFWVPWEKWLLPRDEDQPPGLPSR
jgi:hypothetical protein